MKKIFALIVALAMALSLTACSGDIDTNELNNGSENSSQTNSQDTSKDNNGNDAQNTTENQGASHTHNHSSKVTEPTCTEKGYTTYTCSCGDIYTADETAAKGHSYSDATCTKAATCSCGATNGSALGHSWKDATCTSAKKCSRCGETNGSALGHSYSKGKCTRCSASDPNYTEQDTTSKTVYTTATGKKYHSTKNCSGLSNAKAIYESTLSAAKDKGLGPCSKCY